MINDPLAIAWGLWYYARTSTELVAASRFINLYYENTGRSYFS